MLQPSQNILCVFTHLPQTPCDHSPTYPVISRVEVHVTGEDGGGENHEHGGREEQGVNKPPHIGSEVEVVAAPANQTTGKSPFKSALTLNHVPPTHCPARIPLKQLIHTCTVHCGATFLQVPPHTELTHSIQLTHSEQHMLSAGSRRYLSTSTSTVASRTSDIVIADASLPSLAFASALCK